MVGTTRENCITTFEIPEKLGSSGLVGSFNKIKQG